MFNIKVYSVDKDKLPRNVLSMGYFFLFSTLVIGIIILFLLPLQEKVTGNFFLYLKGIPVQVKSPSQGKLNLYVQNNDLVQKDDYIASVGWNLTENELSLLDTMGMFSLDFDNPQRMDRLVEHVRKCQKMDIPELQGDLSSILSSIDKYNLFIKSRFPQKQLNSIKNEMRQKYKTLEQINRINSPQNKNLVLLQKTSDDNKKLLEDGVISRREYEASEAEIWKSQESKINVDIRKESIQEEITALQSSQANIYEGYQQDISTYQLDIFDKVDALKSKYHTLIDKRIIRATINGSIAIDPYLTDRIEVSQGDNLFEIISSKEAAKERKFIVAPFTNINNIEPGQTAYLNFAEYKASDVGFVKAMVESKSLIPRNNKYEIHITLPDSLTTTRGIKLPYENIYQGTAEIMVSKKTMAQSIWNEIIHQGEKYQQ